MAVPDSAVYYRHVGVVRMPFPASFCVLLDRLNVYPAPTQIRQKASITECLSVEGANLDKRPIQAGAQHPIVCAPKATNLTSIARSVSASQQDKAELKRALCTRQRQFFDLALHYSQHRAPDYPRMLKHLTKPKPHDRPSQPALTAVALQ